MRVRTKLVIAIAIAMLIPAVGAAQGPEPPDPEGHELDGGGMHRGRGDDRGLGFLAANPEIRQRLGISDEQAAKIRQQDFDFRKAEIRLRADLQVKRLELRSLMEAETPDRAAIDRTLQEAGAARIAVEKNAIDHHLAMRAALTPEQRQKLQQMRREIRDRRSGQPARPRMRHPGTAGTPQTPAPPAQR